MCHSAKWGCSVKNTSRCERSGTERGSLSATFLEFTIPRGCFIELHFATRICTALKALKHLSTNTTVFIVKSRACFPDLEMEMMERAA